jgi:hypothetical protein
MTKIVSKTKEPQNLVQNNDIVKQGAHDDGGHICFLRYEIIPVLSASTMSV